MASTPDTFLFEVSWEVCNMVGGIYTVLATKAGTAARTFGNNYCVLGPDLKTNAEFEETDEPFWNDVRESVAIKDIPCRFGRWRISGSPRAILVSPGQKYNKDQLLFSLWEAFGVDSISGHWDYVEPVMFSYACGEVIESLYNVLVRPRKARAVAHFHEWLAGAGLLRVKKHLPEIGTVFTTHATILGRSLAGSGMDVYSELETLSPKREAAALNITAKYSMESAAAREADAFTTVSEITGIEARSLLGRAPSGIVPNGLDMNGIPDVLENESLARDARARLLDFASRFLGRQFPAKTRIMLISGRYEFHNKGIDAFLEALHLLENDLGPDDAVLALFMVLAGHKEVAPAALPEHPPRGPGPAPIATHRLDNEAGDPILTACNRLGLRNAPENRVNVVFCPAFLNGYDGAINLPYYTALSGSDLGVFPSYYEPWGYTPLESAAYAVPTITTDQAGFGLWAHQADGDNSGVILMHRRGKDMPAIEEDLHQILRQCLGWSDAERLHRRQSARHLARKADWSEFFRFYQNAYDEALAAAERRLVQDQSAKYREEMRHTFVGIASTQPHFRAFHADVQLPEAIGRLRELAYNLWWAWNPEALALFSHLDPRLWEETMANPVRVLESISSARLDEMAADQGYTALYSQILQRFDDYMKGRGSERAEALDGIRWASPIAYFSMEFGLHDSLPIYSGGLGVLSGDHLKSASDLNLPLVGVGLLYRNGYFRQAIDRDGWQHAEHPEFDFSDMPVQRLRDEVGNTVEISMELPGRVLHANIWEVKVGRVTLYLLDTDTHLNTPQDRRITANLYCADRRTRIEQELLLGIGGVRLLRKLGFKPSVYHMNEGHSAFLLLERILGLMLEEGLSFEEAKEVVRSTTVFTTHTPVEAGHERFDRDIFEYYFASYVQRAGISWSQLWELGRRENGDEKPFYMTMMGLKLSYMRNAVSRMHEAVSRRMWSDAWKGFHASDVPIIHVTNGIHVPTFVAGRMAGILNTYLGLDWDRKLSNPERWRRVHDIPNSTLWQVRRELKQEFIGFLRDNLTRHWTKYGDAAPSRDSILARIDPGALWIGFARRFAPYKRADLLLSDLDRLDALVNSEARPVHIVFGGKAHPDDKAGIEALRRVIDAVKNPRLRGRVFFLEDYDMRAARFLLRGVDLWLNTPRRPYEASGTSGQKVVVNGVLNASIADGWWREAQDGTNGWTIGEVGEDVPDFARDTSEADAKSLYALLETSIVPLFYARDADGIPQQWLSMVKRSMETLVPRFNTERMLREYLARMYVPTAERGRHVAESNHRMARELADWKRKIPTRFASVRLLDVSIKSAESGGVLVGRPFTVLVRVDPGKLEPSEILVELVAGRSDGKDFVGVPECVPLSPAGEQGHIRLFHGEYHVRETGQYSYGIRVLPHHKDLDWKQEAELVLWG